MWVDPSRHRPGASRRAPRCPHPTTGAPSRYLAAASAPSAPAPSTPSPQTGRLDADCRRRIPCYYPTKYRQGSLASVALRTGAAPFGRRPHPGPSIDRGTKISYYLDPLTAGLRLRLGSRAARLQQRSSRRRPHDHVVTLWGRYVSGPATCGGGPTRYRPPPLAHVAVRALPSPLPIGPPDRLALEFA